jgi:hypothetical protein
LQHLGLAPHGLAVDLKREKGRFGQNLRDLGGGGVDPFNRRRAHMLSCHGSTLYGPIGF